MPVNSKVNLNEMLLIESQYGVVIHRDFKPLYADDNYAHYFGYESGENILSMASILPLIAPQEQQNAVESYQAVMSGKERPGVRTYRNIDNQGSELIVLSVDHVVDWEGQPAMQVTIIDLRHHVETQRQLRASEERYRALVDGSIQGILVHKNFRPLFCNEAYAQMQGFSNAQELMEHGSILPLIDMEHHPQAYSDNLQLLVGEKEAIKTEAKGVRTDGSTVWLSLLSRPIIWNGEQVVQVTAMDITEQQLLKERLEHRANFDGLTNLLNRRATMELLEKQFEFDKRNGNDMCCILIDFDDFKLINDCYGHHVGDQVLKLFGKTCKKSIRKSDFIGRWGGEEFVMVLPRTAIDQAAFIARRISKCISEQRVEVGEHTLSFTVSMGVAAMTENTTSAEQMINAADKALYQGKKQGKSCVVIAA